MGNTVKFQKSLTIQAQALVDLMTQLDLIRVRNIIFLISQCEGILVFTGVGKNGMIAHKLASTFNSLGIRSIFIDPVEALHGNMGFVQREDLVIALSKSGATQELYGFLEKLETSIILFHSNKSYKKLPWIIDNLYIPVEQEADQNNMAPTTSSICYMAVLQAIACEISTVTKEGFKLNHPGGALGRL